ncbi:MAG: peptidylprolyl isomerase [Terracidiphilus sp.]|jgi:peptidyl-prolyl cis-trans isomerase SurA
MTLRLFRTLAAFALPAALLASYTLAQTPRPGAPESPYGGVTVAEIIARINDQIITRADYERAMNELDNEARQRGASMQEISEGHRDLLRNLIDQQLWLSKGKELSITGETELVNRLNEIRKQYNLESMEDLEKAAKEQGISFEDFKANVRNSIITQEVMRREVGRKVQFTPGEAERYFEQHKQEYARPESVTLAEILVSTGAPSQLTPQAGTQPDDPAKLAAAKAKADDIEAKLHAGGDFAQLARNFSDGPTAAEGGDLGQFQHDKLAKVLEDKTFALKSGEFTEPIRTKQGYVILKVVEHVPGGVPAYKDVESQVEENFYMARMEPAMRDYLTTMREQAYIDIKPGYTDSGASPRETKPIYSAYVPPTPKKKKAVERTRFRENTHAFRQKGSSSATPAESAAVTPATAPAKSSKKTDVSADQVSMKPGKKEKIRYGKAPTKTLPTAPETPTEDAGGGAATQIAAASPEPENPLEASRKPTQKSRYSARAKVAKQQKASGPRTDTMAPAAPGAAEVADRQTQASPLGLGGDTTKKKKKKATTTGDKTRMADKKKSETPGENTGDVPLGPAPAPAPQTPAPAPQK